MQDGIDPHGGEKLI